MPKITEELIADILHKLNMKVRSKEIINVVMSRYNIVKGTTANGLSVGCCCV